jgi:molecular chaperone GrpE
MTEQKEENTTKKKDKHELEELGKRIDDLQKEKDDVFAKLQRVAADYDNYQKRTARQITDSIMHEKTSVMKSLLPILDNFERTLQNVRLSEDADPLVKGVRMIYDQMLTILTSYGVEQVKALGERFDPAFHEAITQTAQPDKQDSLVLEEVQKGYKMNGRVIRPSRVVVNKLPAPPTLGQAQQPPVEQIDKQPPPEAETTDTQ